MYVCCAVVLMLIVFGFNTINHNFSIKVSISSIIIIIIIMNMNIDYVLSVLKNIKIHKLNAVLNIAILIVISCIFYIIINLMYQIPNNQYSHNIITMKIIYGGTIFSHTSLGLPETLLNNTNTNIHRQCSVMIFKIFLLICAFTAIHRNQTYYTYNKTEHQLETLVMVGMCF